MPKPSFLDIERASEIEFVVYYIPDFINSATHAFNIVFSLDEL